MNGLVAALAFLLGTVMDGNGGVCTMTYSAQLPATPGVDLGTRTVGAGFLAGYYTIQIGEVGGTTPDDNMIGTMHVTAP
jgi:hypothetical protein